MDPEIADGLCDGAETWKVEQSQPAWSSVKETRDSLQNSL